MVAIENELTRKFKLYRCGRLCSSLEGHARARTKSRIHRCLQENRAELDRQQESTRHLTSRLETVERELTEIDAQLHHPEVRPVRLI